MELLLFCGVVGIGSAQLGIREMYEHRRDFSALFMLLQKCECWFFDTGEQKTGVDVV